MEVKKNHSIGIVISSKANYFYVDIDTSKLENVSSNQHQKNKIIRILCTKRNKLNYFDLNVSVGDNVFVESIDWKGLKGVISKVHKRKSWLKRPPVANVTNIVIILSASQPKFDIDQASKFLLTGEFTGLDVNLVLNKKDLITVEELKYFIEKLKSWGYDPISISTKTGEGIDFLKERLQSFKLSVLCGPSGVGKSSLINYLLLNNIQSTSTVSKKLKRGRHTTRHVELFSLGKGSLIADTPGFNRPEIEVEPKNLAYLFPELRTQIIHNKCKFRDCLHRDEPGCVVSKDWERYSNYRSFLDELIILHQSFQGG